MNRVTLIGRSGSKPELRYTPNQTAVLKPSLAISKRQKDATGNWIDGPTTWVTVTLFGKRAETLATQIEKGTQVFVEGELSIREYQAKDGSKKVAVEVVCNQAYVISNPRRQASDQDLRQAVSSEWGGTISEDDIPF